MKKLKIFEINDGLDGVVLAKSLKQAIKKLSVCYKTYSVSDIIKSIKKQKKNFHTDRYGIDWDLTSITKVIKKGKYRRPRILGWREW